MRRLIPSLLLIALLAGAPAEAAPHWELDISWTQTAPDNETGYRLERKLGMTGTYAPLVTLGPNVTSFRDVGPYTDGQVVCIQVVALPEAAAGANRSDESCANAPIQFPGKPGAPSLQFQFIPN